MNKILDMANQKSEPNDDDVIVWDGINYLGTKIKYMPNAYLESLHIKVERFEKALRTIIDSEFRYGTALVDGVEKTPMRIAREALEPE